MIASGASTGKSISLYVLPLNVDLSRQHSSGSRIIDNMFSNRLLLEMISGFLGACRHFAVTVSCSKDCLFHVSTSGRRRTVRANLIPSCPCTIYCQVFAINAQEYPITKALAVKRMLYRFLRPQLVSNSLPHSWKSGFESFASNPLICCNTILTLYSPHPHLPRPCRKPSR